MILRRLIVEAFGPFADWRLDLAEGINLVEGPNEAGKSSLMRFLLWLLFPVARGEADLVTPHGGPPSGELDLELDGQMFRVSRRGRAEPRLVDASGRELPGGLGTLLGGLPREMYKAIYAFSASELISLEGLGKEEARQRLFAGALAGAGRSVAEARKELDRRTNTLWRPRSDGPLRQVRTEIEELERRLEEARRRAAARPTVEARLAELHTLRAAAELRLARAGSEERRMAALEEAWSIEQERQEMETRLEALRGLPTLLPERAEKLRRVEGSVADAHRQLLAIQQEEAETRDRIASLRVDEQLLNEQPALTPLLDQSEGVARAVQTAHDLSARITEDRRSLSRHRQDAGLEPTTDWLRLDLSAARVAGLRAAALACQERESWAAECRRVELDRQRVVRDLEATPTLTSDRVGIAAQLPLRELQKALGSLPADQQRQRELETRLQAARIQVQARLRNLHPPFSGDLRAVDLPTAHRLEELAHKRAEYHRAREAQVRPAAERRALAERELRSRERVLQNIPPEPEDDLDGVLATLRAAESAHRTARLRAEQRLATMEERRRSAEELLAGLSPNWRQLTSTPLTEDDLRELVSLARNLEQARRNLAANPGPHGVSGRGLAPTTHPEELREQLLRLRLAREAANERDRLASGLPTFWLYLSLTLGAICTLVGILLLIGLGETQSLPGGLAALLAGMVLLALAFGLRDHVVRDTPDLGPLRAAGLPHAEPRRAIEARVEEVAEALRAAQIEAAQAGSATAARDRHQQLAEAEAAWARAGRQWGWPAGLAPEGAERALWTLLRAQQDHAAADRAQAEAHLAAAEAATFTENLRRACAHWGVDNDLTALLGVQEARRQSRAIRTTARTALETARVDLALATEQLRQLETIPTTDPTIEGPFLEIAQRCGFPPGLSPSEMPAWAVAFRLVVEAQNEATRLHRELHTQNSQIAEHHRTKDALLAELGVADLPAAEARVAAALHHEGNLQLAEARRLRLQEELRAHESRATRLDEQDATLSGAPAEWLTQLTTAGLSPQTPPTGLEAALVAAREARDIALRLPEMEASLREAEQRLASWLHSLAHLANRPDWSTEEHRPEALRWLRARAAAGEAAARTQAELRSEQDRLAALQTRREAAEHLWEDSQQQFQAALAEVGLEGPEQIRSALERSQECARLEADLRGANQLLRKILGDPQAAPDLYALLREGDRLSWSENFAQATAQRQREMEQIEHLHREQGAVEAQLRQEEQGLDIPELSATLGQTIERRRTLLRELFRLRLTDRLLEEGLSSFRQRHAPGVFRVASAAMSLASRGAWPAMEASPDEREVLLLDPQGHRRSAIELSRGTLDLAYICLRLGLAEEQRPNGQLLPLLLDDVLVNLDPERATGLAAVLAEQATRRQILLFSCRPETRGLLSNIPHHHIPLQRWAGANAPRNLSGARNTRAAPRPEEPRGAPEPHTPHRDTLLATIREAPQGLGRAELLRRSGLPESAWQATIRSLVEDRLVQARGEGRGTVYLPTA